MSELGQRILEARKKRGFTQRDLAEKLRVSVQAVSQWETGKTDPTPRLGRISDALEISSEWLSGNDDRLWYMGRPISQSAQQVPLIEVQDVVFFMGPTLAKKFADVTRYFATNIKAVEQLFAIEYMENIETLKAGDVLIFDTGVSATVGDIVAGAVFNSDGGAFYDLANSKSVLETGMKGGVFAVVGDNGITPQLKFLSLKEPPPSGNTTFVIGTMVERRTYRSYRRDE